MDPVNLGVFLVVYLGMILGGLPGLALDRTGVALLGAIALLASGRLSAEEAWRSADVPTIGLLFGLMIVSAQFRLGGFYAATTRRLATAPLSPPGLLAWVVVAAGVLSALLANDIVCLAMTPLLVEGCARRRLDPVPHCLGLACASNIGSAATLIGNPQNMLIGQKLQLSFAGYLVDALVPSVFGMAAAWAILAWLYRGRWVAETPLHEVQAPPFNAYQTGKGAIVLTLLLAAFLFAPWPREAAALAAAGFLLLSRRMHSGHILALVDWPLLVLFFGLFAVNHSLQASGALERMMSHAAANGIDVGQPAPLFVVTVILSNIVSNVPAVMLLLPTATHPQAGPILALASTLAGNLFIVGSIANIIVVDQAARLGVTINWGTHARAGVPVTLVSLAIAAAWLWLRATALG